MALKAMPTGVLAPGRAAMSERLKGQDLTMCYSLILYHRELVNILTIYFHKKIKKKTHRNNTGNMTVENYNNSGVKT